MKKHLSVINELLLLWGAGYIVICTSYWFGSTESTWRTTPTLPHRNFGIALLFPMQAMRLFRK